MGLEMYPADCTCGQPDRQHAVGPYPNNRVMPDQFGPAYREENRHYRQLRMHAGPSPLRDEHYDLLDPNQRLVLKQAHEFCNKTCALYYTFPRPVSSETRDARYKLNDQGYAAWFHHAQSSYRRGNFLYKEIDVADFESVRAQSPEEHGQEVSGRLRKLAKLHIQLCTVLEIRLENVTLSDKLRDPESDEELYDEETETSDHYFSRNEFSFLPSFKKLFLVVDGPNADLILVMLGKREGEGWNVDEVPDDELQALSWIRARPGNVFETLLRDAGLPPSSHPEIMHNGC